jgi:hypothetical protein
VNSIITEVGFKGFWDQGEKCRSGWAVYAAQTFIALSRYAAAPIDQGGGPPRCDEWLGICQ